jgi:hypothetical protein
MAASTIEAIAMIAMIQRSAVRSSGSGATAPPTQASATTAREAGASAMSVGSDVSGTTSVSRAAQRWNGIAPNRIATATAIAR